VEVRVWLLRPRVEVVEEWAGGVKYGESFSLGFSCEAAEGDWGERGDSTGDGSSSRIEIRDGDDCALDSAMMKMRLEDLGRTLFSGKVEYARRLAADGFYDNAVLLCIPTEDFGVSHFREWKL